MRFATQAENMHQAVSNGFEKEESMRLQGKTALVTGATSGIGEAIAQAFTGKRDAVLMSVWSQ